MLEPGEARLIHDYLHGDGGVLRQIDGWIDAVLQRQFASLRDDWDDIRQEVHIRVMHNLERGQFDGRSSLRTYVHRVAYNIGIDCTRQVQRHRERHLETERPVLAPETGADGAVLARDLTFKLLAGVSREERRMLTLIVVERHSYAEVAARLGLPEGTIKSRLNRLKLRILKLRRELLSEGSGAA